MKNKILSILSVIVLLLSISIPSMEVNASSCTHGQYRDSYSSTSNWNTTEKVYTGYYTNGYPEYQICTILNVVHTFKIVCTKCGYFTGSYNYQTSATHSLSH